ASVGRDEAQNSSRQRRAGLAEMTTRATRTPMTDTTREIDVERWPRRFPIVETCTYLGSPSLGAMPRRTRTYLAQFADEWGDRGVRAWHEGWWEIGRTIGALLAPAIGARRGTISRHQNVTVAQAVIASCFRYDGSRRRIVMSDLDFPSKHYLFEGFRRYGAGIVDVEPPDGMRIDTARFIEAIDDRTLLVPLSYVLFRSA